MSTTTTTPTTATPTPHRLAPTLSVDVDGTPFAYRELGEPGGVPVIFVNHLTGVLDDWDPRVVDAVAARHHVITFDNRGVGASGGKTPPDADEMARDAVRFIRALGHDTVDLLGFSLGGGLAQIVAMREPGLVRRAIFAGTGPRGGLGITKIPQIAVRTIAKAAILRQDPKNWLFFTRTADGRAAARDFLGRLRERTEDRDPEISPASVVAQLRAIHKWGRQAPDDLGVLDLPVLVANGIEDMMVPTTNTVDMARRIRGAELLLFPDSGHGGVFQYHEEFSAKVLEFLA